MKAIEVDRLVFLEFEDEVEAFVTTFSDKDRELKNTAIVALSLPVQLALKSRDLPFLNSVSFFNNRSHARGLEQSEEWLQLFEAHLDPEEILHKEVVYCIRLVFSYLFWLSEVVVEAIETLQPGCICCPPGKISADDSRWSITPQDRFLGFMVEAYAQKKQLQIQQIDQPGFQAGPEHHGGTASAPLRKAKAYTFWSRRIKKLLQRFSRQKKILLAASSGYGMDKAIEKMNMETMTPMLLSFDHHFDRWWDVKKFLKMWFTYGLKSSARFQLYPIPVRAFPCDDREAAIRAEQTGKEILSLAHRVETGWRSDFMNRGMDLAPCISAKLRTGILNHLLDLSRLQFQLQGMLELIRPQVVLSPFSSGIFSILGELSRRLDIPGILIPHGGLAKPRDRLDEIEWRRLSQGLILSPYAYAVAQTPLEAAHAAYFGVSKRTFNTGPILFSKVEPKKGEDLRQKLGIPPDTFVILYAVAQRQRSSMRFHIFQTEDEWLSSTADVIRAFKQMKNQKTHLILKLHPAFRFPEARMRLLLPECSQMSILRQEPFAQVLSAADLFVSYISTTVEESLINQIPVVLYDKWQRYYFIEGCKCDEIPTDKWPMDAVYCVHDPDTLTELFTHVFNHLPNSRHKKELFQHYLFAEGDSRPLALHIQEILNE